MRVIRNHYNGKKRTTAVAIYQSLTELASNEGKDIFTAYNSQIAILSGKSISTVKIYCKLFIELGFLGKKNRKLDNKTNLANEWILFTPSVNNNYPTSGKDNLLTSVENNNPLKEETILEENKSKELLSEEELHKKVLEAKEILYKKLGVKQ